MFFGRKKMLALRTKLFSRRMFQRKLREVVSSTRLRPRFELLEDRRVLATIVWDGGAGTFQWGDDLNWSSDAQPGPFDDVIIGNIGNPVGANVAINVATVDSAVAIVMGGLTPFSVGTGNFAGGFSVTASNSVNLGTSTVAGGSWNSATVNGVITNTGALSFPALSVNFGTIINAGTLAISSNSSGVIVNQSTSILAYDGGVHSGTISNLGTMNSTGNVSINSSLDNSGVLEVTAGTLTLGGSVAQHVGSTLTGGRWDIGNGATLNITTGLNITTLGSAADVVLDGSGGFAKLDSLALNQGEIVLLNRSFNTLGSFNNQGYLQLTNAVLNTGANPYTQSVSLSAATQLESSANISTSAFNLDSGYLFGNGSIVGSVTNAASVTPGLSPGVLNIVGNYTQTSSGVLNIEVQGTNAGTPDFDQLSITGTATLDGTLNITQTNNFLADKSESFRIIQAASRIGDFATKSVPQRNGTPLIATTPGDTFYDLQGTSYIVRNTNDSGVFSVRNQIDNANANPGVDQVLFNINAAGVQTIAPLSAFANITSPIIIDATSQNLYAGTPLIEINGGSAGAAANGFKLAVGSNGSIIKGMAINRFSGEGISVDSSNNTISDNFIGTDPLGTIDLGNVGNGIAVSPGANSNTIKNNLVSGNNATGILLQGNSNKVQGNKVGTNIAGTADLGNGLVGVWMYIGSSNFVGVDGDNVGDSTEGNLISGNDSYGVYFQGNSDDNVVAGNLIGTNAAGTGPIGNVAGGIVSFADFLGDNNRIGTDANGTSDDLERNIVSGNLNYGIVDFAVGTKIRGNYVGTTIDGLSALPNAQGGVSLAGSSAIVGGTNDASRNVISGNAGFGVDISTPLGIGNTVLGNFIGVDVNGDLPLANTIGVLIKTGASGNTIGGTAAGARNIISGNSSYGIQLDSVNSNFIQGNYIGTDDDGTSLISNTTTGIYVSDSNNNVIGGTTNEARNVIVGSGDNIWILGGAASNGNRVEGNFIGLDATGNAALEGSTIYQVRISGGSGHFIGGSIPGAGNRIAGDSIVPGDYAVALVGTNNNRVQGNTIGLRANGTIANGADIGILINGGSTGNLIGSDGLGVNEADERNIISGNAIGVQIQSGTTTNNMVAGNYIGTNVAGSAAIPNSIGVQISLGANDNTIGGTSSRERNIISGNTGVGVSIDGIGSSANKIFGNYIGVGADGSTDLGNDSGVNIQNGATGNFIGSGASGTGNVIAGNTLDVILLTNDNKVQGNRISVNAGETAVIAPSFGYSMYLAVGAERNFIGTDSNGTTDDTEGNIIGYASTAAIYVQNNGGAPDSTVIAGNRIGLASDGTTLLNTGGGRGIWLAGATNTRIGSDADGNNDDNERNVIVNPINSNSILLTDGTDATSIAGNYLGTNATGTSGLATGGSGIVVQSLTTPVTNTVIGGTSDAAFNVIASMTYGVVVSGAGTAGTLVMGNRIGTDKDGTAPIGNVIGVSIESGATGITVGGTIAGAGNVISGNQTGLGINDSNSNTVLGNYIGLASDGLAQLANTEDGVYLSGTSVDNTIGSTVTTGANYISGNTRYGISVTVSGTNNKVLGNVIGLNTSDQIRGNGTAGILNNGGAGITIGGTVAGSRNIISGNSTGVWLVTSANNTILGNYIGTNRSGTATRGNSDGIFVDVGSANNTIGGTTAAARNIISGNNGNGVYVNVGSPGNVIQGNYIGTAVDGTTALGNAGDGIRTASAVQIGGLTAAPGTGAGNVISGNGNNALNDYGNIYNGGATGVVIQGNIIGLDANGSNVVRQTTQYGIWDYLATGTIIGGATTTARNIISGNNFGLLLQAGSGLLVQNNYIGTDINGTLDRGNTIYGITTDARNSTFRGNVISGNDIVGFSISGIAPDATNITIAGNIIGLNAAGTAKLGNDLGIDINGADQITIGGTTLADRNVVSGNSSTGITIRGGISTTNVVVRGNYIGLGADGISSLGNADYGLYVYDGVIGTLIGGTAATQANFIGGNSQVGLLLDAAANTQVLGNFIGTDPDEQLNLGNGVGIRIANSATNIIGGLAAGQANVVAFSQRSGIELPDTAAASSSIRGNRVYNNLGLAIDVGPIGPTTNGTAGFRDKPVFTSATISGGNLVLAGTAQPNAIIDLYASNATFDGFGQGMKLLISLTEGLAMGATPDTNAAADAFTFSIPLGLLPQTVQIGSLLAAVSIGSTSEFSANLIVGDVGSSIAPTVDIGSDQALPADLLFEREGTFVDPDSLGPWTVLVNYGDGSPEESVSYSSGPTQSGTGTGGFGDAGSGYDTIYRFQLRHQYATQGANLVTVRVVDNTNAIGSDTALLTGTNQAPDFGENLLILSPPRVKEGESVTLNGRFTDSSLVDTHTVSVDWGDGTTSPGIIDPVTRTFSASHRYIDDGLSNAPEHAYPIQATLIDNSGAIDKTTYGLVFARVVNVLPSQFSLALQNNSITENGFASLSGTFLEPGVLDTHVVTIDWGDGSSPITLSLPAGVVNFSGITHQYLNDPSTGPDKYTITAKIVDDDEPQTPVVASIDVGVANAAPTVASLLLNATTITEGGQVLLSGSIADIGTLDGHTLTIDWGDGTAVTEKELSAGITSFAAIAHTYADDSHALAAGQFAISLTVKDRDGGIAIANTSITVLNDTPTISGIVVTSNDLPVTGAVPEGTKLKVSGSYADAGLIDQQQVRIYWGDGTSSLASVNSKLRTFTATHTLVDDRPSTLPSVDDQIVIVIDDQDLGVNTASVAQVVSNVAPEARILTDLGSSQTLINLKAEGTDAGAADVPTLEYIWSVSLAPGSTGNLPIVTVSGANQGKISIDRNGNLFANYLITLTVKDDEGANTSTTTTLIVLDNSPNVFDGTVIPQPVGAASVTILGLDGIDTIDVRTWTIPVVLDGGAGNDNLTGGTKDDIIYLHQGDDTADGREGDDEFLFTFNSTHTVNDSLGANILNFSPTDFTGAIGVTFDLDKAINDPIDIQDVFPSVPGQHFAVINGTFGELIGTRDNDSLTIASGVKISAGAGSDLIKTRLDMTIAGATINGGADNDVFENYGVVTGLIDFQGDIGADTFTNELGGTIANVDFGGGADNDVFENYGVVNGLIDFQGDFGIDTFTNVFGGTVANIDFGGGADNDVFENYGVVSGSIDFQGDFGADTFTNELGGTIANIDFGGGADNDVFVNEGVISGLVDFQGDFGVDTFTNELGATVANVDFGGGADNDVFVNEGAISGLVDFQGDFGVDTFTNELGATVANIDFGGGADNDVFENYGAVTGLIDFQGDIGADTFTNDGLISGVVEFGGGADNDVFENFGVASGLIDFQGDIGSDTFTNDGLISGPVEFGGGADNDVFQNYGIVSGAIDFQGDSGVDTFTNELGGTIANIDMGGGADTDVFQNYGAVSGTIDFQGDDGRDYFINRASGTTGVIGSPSVVKIFGNADNDVFVNYGIMTSAVDFGGGADNDVFQNYGAISGLIDFQGDIGADTFTNELGATVGNIDMGGGADNDVFQNYGVISGAVDFQGDTGADTFTNDGLIAGVVDMGGGADNDVFVNLGTLGSVDMSGGADNDIFANAGVVTGIVDFQGDSGIDTFVNAEVGGVGRINMGGGADEDYLINYGRLGSIWFVGGTGDDSSLVDGVVEASIYFDGEAGNDVFIDSGSGWLVAGVPVTTIQFIGGEGSDALQNNAANILLIDFRGDIGDDVLQNNGHGVREIRFDSGIGEDTFENNASNVSNIRFDAGAGNDRLFNDGSNVAGIVFNGGDNINALLNTGSFVSQITMNGGADQDFFLSSGSNVSGLTLNGGMGNDEIQNYGPNLTNVTFNGEDGNDLFRNRRGATGAAGLVFNGHAGIDTFVNEAQNVSQVTISGGGDNDVFLNFGFNTTFVDFSGDLGDDVFQNQADDFGKTTSTTIPGAKFVGGLGNDQFFQRGDRYGWLSFDGGDGTDLMNANGNAGHRLSFAGGSDDDTLVSYGTILSTIEFNGDSGDDTLVNFVDSLGEAHVQGGTGDDKIDNRGNDSGWIEFFGGDGADFVSNKGARTGKLQIVGGMGADAVLNTGIDTAITIFDGGDEADALNSFGSGYGSIQYTGGGGDDTLVVDGSGRTGSAIVASMGNGNDVIALKGSNVDANIDAETGNDRFHLFASGQLRLDGGTGNDEYYFIGNPLTQISINEPANADRDLLSFASFTGGGVTLDLAINTSQNLSTSSQMQLTLLNNETGIEDVIGTPSADTIYGNARDNKLRGAESVQTSIAIAATSNREQWVVLDFDSDTGDGEHVYTQLERDAIQRRIEASYHGPGGASNPWFRVFFVQSATALPANVGSNYSTIVFNRTPSSGASGGFAEELDFRNLNLAGQASVQVNGIVGAAGFPEATSENFIALSAKIGAHELGHLLGLRHEDAIGPIGYGLHTPPGSADYKPSFTGPSAGYATFDHLIGSPATTGSDRFNDLRTLFFGEREAVKLAFNDSGFSIPESNSDKTAAASAQAITMAPLSVPNTLASGFNAGKQFQVAALAVTGSITLDGNGRSVSDWYSFVGSKGDLINLAVYSASLNRVSESIDSVLRVYNSSGVLVPYYDGTAVNDDQFEPTDSSLMDLILPADGVYYIEVDTFARPANDPLNDPQNPLSPLNPNYVPPGLTLSEITDAVRDRIRQFQDSLLDADTGSYELFVYRFATSTFDALGDLLVGRGGVDDSNAGPGEASAIAINVPTPPQSIAEGQTWSVSGSFSDLSGFAWSATVDYGNNNGPQSLTLTAAKTFVLQTVYTDDSPDPKLVTVVITNDDGVVATRTLEVQVNNVAPTATIVNSGPIVAGGTVFVSLNGMTDPSLVDVANGLRYSFATSTDDLVTSWAAAQTSPTEDFILTTAGNITLYGRILDKDGGFTTYSTIVLVTGAVANTPPTLVVRAPEDGVKGALASFRFTATDRDSVDANGLFEYRIDWGDGTSIQTVTGGRDVWVQHRFTEVSAKGTFTIQVSVKDARGAQSTVRSLEFAVLGWSVLPDPINPLQTVLVVVGSQDEDDIKIRESNHSDYLRIKIRSEECDVKYRGLVRNDVSRILVFGLGDEDEITIDNRVTIPTYVWGGDGDDKIKGGSGNDVLVGGAGEDRIYGSSGRDLMIGGAGEDRLYGDAGDDILVSGYTSYDTNRLALEAIMAEWGNVTRSYNERRQNISNQTNPKFANRANGSYFFKFDENTAAANTVFDDGEADLLWGDSGLDWFLLNLDGDRNSCRDQARDRLTSETQNDLDRWW